MCLTDLLVCAVKLHWEEVDMSELTYLEEDLVCCLSSVDYQYLKAIPVQCANSRSLEPPMDSGRAVCGCSSLVLIYAKGLVLVMSSAKLSVMEQKVIPQLCDAVTVRWGQFSAGGVPPGSEWKFMYLKGLFTNSLREELSPQNLLSFFHELKNS